MGHSGRRGRQGQKGQTGAKDREREQQAVPLTDEQNAALGNLTRQTSAIASALREAREDGREAMIERLSPITEAEEPLALAYAQSLGATRGEFAVAAADVAQILGEADQRREVAREARRSRLRLQSTGVRSDLTLPPEEIPAAVISPAPNSEAVVSLPTAKSAELARPQLVEAYATRTRESGEMTLLLAWQEGANPETVRGYLIALNFYSTGVTRLNVTEPMSRARFLRETVETLRGNDGAPTTPITWAQARRLLQAALDVHEWRKVPPPHDFTERRERLDELLLGDPNEEQQSLIALEDERAARNGDRPFIAADMEAEETIANWLGAWSFADFGLTYDLLADDAPLRQAQSRVDYIALRRAWADDAQPGAVRLTLVREQRQRASVLWSPGAAGTLSGGQDYEAFWSLSLRDSPQAATLEEMPFATLTSAQTERHWYWTAYTMRRNREFGFWTIARIRDEGLNAQALSIEELQKRIAEAHDAAEAAARIAPADPRDPQAQETVRAVTGDLCVALSYRDTLIAKLPLDETAYRAALDDARVLGNHERAAALLEKMAAKFPDTPRLRFERAIEEYMVADQYVSQGVQAGAEVWLERAIDTMRSVVAEEETAEHLQALGEMQARRGFLADAEQTLRRGLEIAPDRATLHADLAGVIMGRVSGESLDGDPNAPTDEARRSAAQAALVELREAAKLNKSLPHLFTRIGALYDLLGQQEDARLAFEEAAAIDPGDAEARYLLGSLYLSQRRPQDALAQLESAVELEPLAVSFRLNLATAYAALDRRREATRELDTIDRLQPGLPQVAELRAILARKK
jgi:tetratricopeptide (TPR) repeat protein